MNVILKQDLVDGEAPKGTIKPFYWNNSSSNSLYENSTANGHIELESDWKKTQSYIDNEAAAADKKNAEYDGDPKLSGKIKVEGEASDETMLKTITVAFADKSVTATFNEKQRKWTCSPDTADDYKLTITDTANGPTQNGHSVTWTLIVDTSKVITNPAAAVGLEKTITVSVTDASTANEGNGNANTVGTKSTTEDEHTAYYKVDIVPYIAGVKTSLSSLKKNNSSVYDRTALGHYPTATDGTVYVYGFNLTNGTLYDSKGETATLTSVTAANQDWYSSGSVPVGSVYSVSSIAEFTSGEVYIETQAGEIKVKTLNNLNNNDSYGEAYKTAPTKDSTGSEYKNSKFYNRQPNGDNNNLLTDDVEMDVWEINSEAVKPKKGTISQPVMAINPATHDVGFAFVNGALSFSMPGLDHSYQYWIGGIDYWTSIGLTYDSLGNSYATTAGGDINASYADQFRICTSRWGRGTQSRDGYKDGNNQLRLELIGQTDFSDTTNPTNNGYNTFDKERVQSPSIATTHATADSTKVYLAYYDAINDEIRFRYGIFNSTKDKTWKNLTTDQKTASLLGDYYGKGSENGSISGDAGEGRTLRYDASPYYIFYYSVYNLAHKSLIAGQTSTITGKEDSFVSTTKVTALEKVSKPVTTTDGDAVCAGKYVSIAAIENGGDQIGETEIKDDAIVAVWWDGTNNQLLYSYNKTPSSITAGQYTQAETGWENPVAIFGEKNGIGEYCKIAIDKNNGVHIAAYDGLEGDLWYAYIPQFDEPESNGKCIIDSYGIIGTELNIDVVQDDNDNPVPYISYYAGSCAHPKMAYWAGSSSLNTSVINSNTGYGAINEMFTNAWEITLIPTSSKVSVDHINIGTWKDSDSKLTYSTTDGNAPGSENIGVNSFKAGANSDADSYGMVYGNGSMNPILGYAITKGAGGFIETAQMK